MVAEPDPGGGALPWRLELRGLSRSFGGPGGSLPVLQGVSVAAGAGEFVSVVGPSGCGKSTLFNLAAGLDRPSRGAVLLDGQDRTGRPGAVAYMPQKDLLFPWRRVLDNTALGLQVQGVARREARRRAAELFPAFGLGGFEHAYPFQLSGGMRQRAALLRTVVQGRSVLLLDEPFGALDSLTRTELQVWLEQVWERFQWTVVLVTHDIREAVYLSDRVYVLSPRPARVLAEISVPLARPRAPELATTPGFLDLEARVTAALREGA